LTDSKQSKLSIGEIALRGTIMAIIITVPSIMSFVIVWTILDNLLYAIIVGTVIHFIAMGFSLNLSKKLLVKK
jgi:inner membrane protein involved in colicin E2 resistance